MFLSFSVSVSPYFSFLLVCLQRVCCKIVKGQIEFSFTSCLSLRLFSSSNVSFSAIYDPLGKFALFDVLVNFQKMQSLVDQVENDTMFFLFFSFHFIIANDCILTLKYTFLCFNFLLHFNLPKHQTKQIHFSRR